MKVAKLGIYVAFAVLMVTLGIISAMAAEDSSNIQIVAESINPEPVEPGNDLTLKVRLYNAGKGPSEDLKVNLKVQYPFHLKSQSQDFDELSVCGGCSKDNSYYLSIASDAISGSYPLTFEVQEKGGAVKTKQDIQVRVAGRPDITFSSESKVDNVKAKDLFVVDLLMKNIGTGTARNIKITSTSPEFVKQGTGMELIKELKPGAFHGISMQFRVGDGVEPNSYSLPFAITYSDEQGSMHNSSQNFGLTVVHGARLNIQSLKISPEMPSVAESTEIQMRIENVGTGDAQDVKVYLDGPFDGTKVSYIGKLEKNDDAPVVFNVLPSQAGNLNATLRLSYKDDFGDHEVVEHFGLSSRPGKNSRLYMFVPASLGLAGAIYYLGRKRKRSA